MPFKEFENQDAYAERGKLALEKSAYDKKSFLEKAAGFLGIENFGKGLGTTIFLMTPEGKQLQKNAEAGDEYAVKAFSDIMNATPSNKEIVGSAALTGLNILGGGVLKGAKTLGAAGKIATGAGTGAAFGAAGAMDANKGLKEGITQTAIGAATGGVLAGVGVVANKTKNAIAKGGQEVAERTMNSAVKPAIKETEKIIEKGGKTLGRELIDRNIKGGSKKLFQIAKEQLNENGKKLTQVLKEKHADKFITRQDIVREFKSMLVDKMGTPTLKAKADIEKIRSALNLIPQKVNVLEANGIKRRLYKDLGSKAYELDPNLSVDAEISEKIAEAIKKNIEKKTGDVSVRLLNKELSIFKQLKDSARENIARTTRNQVAGVGTIGATIEKVVGAVPVKTRAAVKIDKLSKAIEKINASSAGKFSKTQILNLLNYLRD